MKRTLLTGIGLFSAAFTATAISSSSLAATASANQALSGAYTVIDSDGCAAINAHSSTDVVILATEQSITVGELYSFDIGTVTSATSTGFFNEFETAYVSSYAAEGAQFTAIQETVDRLNPANPTFSGEVKITLTGNSLRIEDSQSHNGQPVPGPTFVCLLNKN